MRYKVSYLLFQHRKPLRKKLKSEKTLFIFALKGTLFSHKTEIFFTIPQHILKQNLFLYFILPKLKNSLHNSSFRQFHFYSI